MTDKKKHIVKHPIYVSNKKCGLTNWLPPIQRNTIDIETNSWFDIKYTENPYANLVEEYETIIPIIPPESYKQQMKSIKIKKSKKEPVFLFSKKIRIYPTKLQQEILHSWFDAFASMFNQTINYIRRVIFIDGKLLAFKEVNKKINFVLIRKQLYDIKHKIQQSTNEYPIPIHVLDEAIKQAISSYKTCITNLAKGNIKKFHVKEWSNNRRKKILIIESSFFKNKTIFPRTFLFMKSSGSLSKINRTSILQYNKDTGKYILFVPDAIKPKKIINKKLSGGIDLGVRTFATSYSQNNTHAICNDIQNNKYIKNYHKKIDNLNNLLQLKPDEREIFIVSKINGENVEKMKTIKRSSIKRALRKYHLKIKNKITDMHYKTAHELVNTFDKIYIGDLNTKKILSRNNITIGKKTKRMLGILSPYLFKQRLTYMGYKYGALVTKVSEYLTTVTCSHCGRINDIGKKKIHKCVCGMIADRDENSSKNHLKIGFMSEKKKSKVKKRVNGKEMIEV
jgi:transposase